jgi:hypothetical protein
MTDYDNTKKLSGIPPWPGAFTHQGKDEAMSEDQSRDAKHAAAFRDLEGEIRDLERAAKIAHGMFIPDQEEDVELCIFAVRQVDRMATDLVRLWDEKFHACSTKGD